MARKKKTARKTAAKRKTTTKRKTTKKKTTAKRKTAAKPKAAAKKAPVKKASVRIGPSNTPRTKSQIMNIISEDVGMSKKEVTQVFESLEKTIKADMGPRGCKVFTVPGLMKITVKRKPATKARKGINPFTGEEMMFKAKPARNVIKVRPLKKLKEMV